MTGLHVVFGTGPLALAVMRALRARGATVRMINRSGRVRFDKDLETQVGGIDAADPAQAKEVCEGARAVYHCVGLPYPQWERLPAIAAGILAGAAHAGAPLIYGDNLYAYGEVAGPMHEDLPDAATTRKGRIRAQVAQRLLRAHRDGDAQVAIARGSDFFGPFCTENAAMGSRVFGKALAGGTAQVPGNAGALHTYTFIDDFAGAMVALAGRPDALGSVWHVPSPAAVTTRAFVECVYLAAGRTPKLIAAPRRMVQLLGLFDPRVKELLEVLYQFERDFVMDSSRFEQEFGMHATPLDDAIARTLDWFRSRQTRH